QIDASTNAISTPRRLMPYGESRNAQPSGWIGTKGFIDGTQDGTTGLTNLGAREYDPSTGRFIARDPVFNTKDPQSCHGYAYTENTAVTGRGPLGLMYTNPSDSSGFCDSACQAAIDSFNKAQEQANKADSCSDFWCKLGHDVHGALDVAGAAAPYV